MVDSENTIWLVSENEIGAFKPETNEYTSKINNIDAVEVRGAIEDSKKNIWFTINGLYFYERASDDFTYYKKDIKQENSLASDFTVIPFEDNQDTFW